MEDNFVKYQIAEWILLSVLLVLAWGVGVLMLLYLPIQIYVCRRDFRSRKLYLTPHTVVYKINKSVAFPCFGVFKEKYVILPSISDVVVDQGYLQSFFGVYSIRIENVGVRKLPSDYVKITGVAHPHDFRKAVLVHLLNTMNMLNDNWTRGLWRMTTTEEIAELIDLWTLMQNVQLVDREDEIVWRWTADGSYTARSAYEVQFRGPFCTYNCSAIWKAKVEGKASFFGVAADSK